MKNNIEKKNFVWNFIGLSIYGFSSLFLLLIVKYINGLDESGIFSYAFSLCTLFFYISLFFNRTYQITNYNDNKDFNDYLSVRLIFCTISIILITIYSLITNVGNEKMSVILILMLYRIIDAISDIFYGYFQSKDKLYLVGVSYTLKSILSILMFFIVDCITNNLIIASTSIFITNLLIFIFYDLKKFKNDKIKINFKVNNFKLIIKESFSIFLFTFLSVFLSNSQKYLLAFYADNSIQSIFAIIIMPATIISLISGYIVTPFVNKLKNLCSERKYKNVNKISISISGIIIALGLAGAIFCYYLGIDFLNIIYGEDLNEYRLDLFLVIIGSTFNAITAVYSCLLTIIKQNKRQIIFYLISSIFVVIYCLVMFNRSNTYIHLSVMSYICSYGILMLCYTINYGIVIKKIFKEGELDGKKEKSEN